MCRAAQSRQACPEEPQEPSSGAAKGARGHYTLTKPRGLQQREGVADALALARAEGQHRVVCGDLQVGHPQPRRATLRVVALPTLDLVVVEGVVPPGEGKGLGLGFRVRV